MKTSASSKRTRGLTVLMIAAPMLAACANYYQVTDPDSGKSYYTRDIDLDDGHVEFTDKATGDKVGLDRFEIREVTSQQYNNAVRR